MVSQPTVPAEAGPRLRRALGLWDLILYGMIVIQPTAPMPVYGVMSQRARGHAVTTVLIAMVAMLFTAISYGRMARAYPSAGSAFTYVGSEIHPALGYVTGWSMAMDYMLNPIVCTILCSKFALNFLPEIPYAVWVVVFVTLFTGLNLFGIRTSARINTTLAGGMGVVILIFLAAAARRSEEHTSELQSPMYLVCRLLLEKKKYTGIQRSATCPPSPLFFGSPASRRICRGGRKCCVMFPWGLWGAPAPRAA